MFCHTVHGWGRGGGGWEGTSRHLSTQHCPNKATWHPFSICLPVSWMNCFQSHARKNSITRNGMLYAYNGFFLCVRYLHPVVILLHWSSNILFHLMQASDRGRRFREHLNSMMYPVLTAGHDKVSSQKRLWLLLIISQYYANIITVVVIIIRSIINFFALKRHMSGYITLTKIWSTLSPFYSYFYVLFLPYQSSIFLLFSWLFFLLS